MRPKGVILKYKELIRKAARDEVTLVRLENDLRMIQLQQAKKSDPWQLITQPTLLKNHVAPSKRIIVLLGSLTGFFISILISFFRENNQSFFFLNYIVPETSLEN